ncbi:MAG: endonuclease/exonuclease/phosphatase family protein [Nannocystales bacterium]
MESAGRTPRLTTLAGAAVLLGLAGSCGSDPAPELRLRVATYNTSLYRDERGALAAAVRAGDPQAADVAAALLAAHPDIVLLNEIDADAVEAFATSIPGQPYPHRFVPPSNTGHPTGIDLDRDGITTGPGDARGFGRYPGQYGMALLSRFPIESTRCFGDVLWASLPWATLPDDASTDAPADYYSPQAQAALPLSSKNHCDVVVRSPLGRVHLLISHPTPPAFDGPEDRNGHRNRDEVLFWVHHIDTLPAAEHFVVLGDLNADPTDGGAPAGITALLAHPRIQDPKPTSEGAASASRTQKQANTTHLGDPRLDTADFSDDTVGNLRVDYVLPSRTLRVLSSAVQWPAAVERTVRAEPSDHHLVWVDVATKSVPKR